MASGAAQGAASGAAAGSGAGVTGMLVGGTLGVIGGIQAERAQRKFRRRQRKAIASARTFADETVAKITGGELFQSAQQFLQNSFAEDGDSPLAKDFAKSIRAAQSVRGTFSGNLGAAQEAVGTSAFQQRLRQSLLPQALQFSEAPERLRQSILAQEAPLRVAAATGAQIAGVGPQGSIGGALGSALTQGVSGALGGFQAGSAVGAQNQFQSQLDALRLAKTQRETGQGSAGSFSTGNVQPIAGGNIAQGSSFVDERIRQFSGTA